MINDLPGIVLSLIKRLDFDDIFVIDTVRKQKYSYRQIFSYALKSSIFPKSSPTYIVRMDNGVGLLVCYFAALLQGKVIVPVDINKAEDEVQRICRIHSDAFYIDSCDINYNAALISDKEIIRAFQELDFQGDYLITYTSGSTGEPKGVVHSAYNLFYSAMMFGKRLGFDKKVRMCHTMPMTYMAGILNTIILPFVTGGQIVLFPRFSAVAALGFWQCVLDYNVNTFWLSPTMLHLLMKVNRGDTVKNHLQAARAKIFVGTAPLTKELRREFEDKFQISVYQSYGLSETLFISSADVQHHSQGSVGALLEGVKLDFERSGEILIDVPWMMKRYENIDPSSYFRHGRYVSGDLGEMRGEELYITGRLKDLIIRGGLNIRPTDIEDAVLSFGGAEEVSVLSAFLNGEERIVCCYSGEKMDEALTNRRVTEQLGKAYKVDRFIYMDDLPHNLNGKVDKIKLGETVKSADKN